jgi:hypothetical protein
MSSTIYISLLTELGLSDAARAINISLLKELIAVSGLRRTHVTYQTSTRIINLDEIEHKARRGG